MTLSALIKKGGLTRIVTATPATIATQNPTGKDSVAETATVAAAYASESPGDCSPRTRTPLTTASEEIMILAWLAHIEEVLNSCRSSPEALAYFLARAKKMVNG